MIVGSIYLLTELGNSSVIIGDIVKNYDIAYVVQQVQGDQVLTTATLFEKELGD